MRSFLSFSLLGAVLAFLSACSSDPASSGQGGSGGSGGSGGAGGGSAAVCTTPAMVPCSDQVILNLNFQTDITPGLITNEPDGAGFISTVDATAGGAFAADPNSYTYGKFTETGLVKVEISDQQSIDSMDWDIAFRRYVVRINSGNSGPSCVAVTPPSPANATYDEVMSAPGELAIYRTDDYFSAACEVIPDGNGLDTPNTALNGYWSYTNCVKMTDRVSIVRLADGKHLKFTITDYYLPAVQEQCDTTDMIPMMGTGSANFRVRWAFLP